MNRTAKNRGSFVAGMHPLAGLLTSEDVFANSWVLAHTSRSAIQLQREFNRKPLTRPAGWLREYASPSIGTLQWMCLRTQSCTSSRSSAWEANTLQETLHFQSTKMAKVKVKLADHSGRAVWVMNCLPSLERWDRGFETHSRHGCLHCVHLFCVCVVLCVGRGLATGLSPVQGVLPTVYRIKKLKKRPRFNKGL
jgi:hypothetical protein